MGWRLELTTRLPQGEIIPIREEQASFYSNPQRQKIEFDFNGNYYTLQRVRREVSVGVCFLNNNPFYCPGPLKQLVVGKGEIGLELDNGLIFRFSPSAGSNIVTGAAALLNRALNFDDSSSLGERENAAEDLAALNSYLGQAGWLAIAADKRLPTREGQEAVGRLKELSDEDLAELLERDIDPNNVLSGMTPDEAAAFLIADAQSILREMEKENFIKTRGALMITVLNIPTEGIKDKRLRAKAIKFATAGRALIEKLYIETLIKVRAELEKIARM